MTAPPDDTTTDLHAVIAALRAERDHALADKSAERDAGLAREMALAEALATRNTDYGERIDHQAATLDVLKAMSASPGDPQPVFDLLTRRATELCESRAAVYELREGQLNVAASHGMDLETIAAFRRNFPRPPDRSLAVGRAILERRIIHVRDVSADTALSQAARDLGGTAIAVIPLLRDGEPIGAVALNGRHPGGYSESQIALLQIFAEQAVIAITNAETYRALQTRTVDLQESLEYQTATAEMLKVISRSAFDLQPVLDTVVETAARLCVADQAVIARRDGDLWRLAANFGFPPEYEAYQRSREAFQHGPDVPSVGARVEREKVPVHIHDVAAVPGYPEFAIRLGKQRTSMGVPLLRAGEVVGSIVLARQRVEPFTDRQIALVSTFADQAVIAIENTRLLTEQQEALEQQTATAEVLQVINASPGNLTPVFDAMLEKAMRLCGAAFGSLYTYDGEGFRSAAHRGVPRAYAEWREKVPPSTQTAVPARILKTKRSIHVVDLMREEDYIAGDVVLHNMVALGGIRTALSVPLLKDDAVLGFITIFRQEVHGFSNEQIALLENFASQAVIAIENARLLDEIRQHQEELRVTFENMGDGVAMFDETLHLVAWNRKFQDILDVPDEAMEERRTFEEYIRYLTERGEFGLNADPDEQVLRLQAMRGDAVVLERTRPNGRIIEVRQNPVASGGFVLIYADITERKHNEAEIRAARDAAEAAFRELKAAQANLIQAEKMASLGQLTAGIAHEIKNPLNFVNNFAALSVDLLSELKESAAPGFAALTDDQRAEIEDVSAMLTSNLEKITEHGKRADGIVKAMLEHSRVSSAERRMVDLNAVIDEALNLAYHGARAQDQSFNVTLDRNFGEGIAPIEVNPQDVTRVFLNIFSNGFYAATRRARNGGDTGFVPTLKVTTRDGGEALEIRVWDNGTGIPADIRDKLFQPFFTTKPTGEGTGLGLSITYDIVTKQHGGTITVESEVDEFTEFVITLPRQMFANGGSRA